ncbi:ATP-binding protein [Chitiniphilus purpureus]|uniref:histidine kinase n=1 Tax=Chitiniphilus purpureus TaxID=2981137 RepID=A0ABY6DLS1_9NEIS|nr:ATP-binding protein [Chitiniphilus sp. CD1]UXY14426.1 ATP-binding protein [Chitiniphilus sp. CD1]
MNASWAEQALATLPLAAWFKEASLHYVWVNAAWADFLDCPPAECMGRLDRDLLPAPSAEALEIGDLRAQLRGPTREEVRLTARDAREQTLLLYRVPHYDRNGEFDGLTTLAVDITQQHTLARQIETLVQEMEVQRQALHQHALVSITSSEGNYLYVSEPLCALSGYTQEQLLGTPRAALGFVPEGGLGPVLDALQLVNVERFEIHGKRNNGQDFWLQSLLVPMGGPGDAARRYFEISTDITAIKQREETLEAEVRRRTEELRRVNEVLEMDVDVREQVEADLRHQHALVQSMLASITAEILLLSGKGLLLQTNLPWDQFAETEAEDGTLHAAIPGDNFIEYCRSLANPIYHLLADRLAEILAGSLSSYEFQYQEPARSGLRAFSFTASAWNGEERGIIIIQQDITDAQQNAVALEKRNAELVALNAQLQSVQHQLLQSEKLASIGQLAAGIAHEINNPIGYVSSNLGSLGNYVNDLLTLVDRYAEALARGGQHEQQAELAKARTQIDFDFMREDIDSLLGECKEGITRVKRIVQDLKDFSRVDATQDWAAVDLHAGLDSTLNIVHNEIKYKAEVVKDYGELPLVECMISQLNQVFLNLLVNAGHAIEANGRIGIRTRHVGDEVCVSFSDNGCGIPQANLNRIFDPFFTTKPIGQGTGLGLSLSYGIVQKHHGRIEVHSRPNEGTTFDIWLPVRQPAPLT